MKRWVGFLVKILCSGMLLIIIVDKLGISELAKRLSESRLDYLLVGAFLGIVCNILKVVKWGLLLKGGIECSFLDGLRSYTIGFSFGLITPFRAGELGRAFYFDRSRYLYVAGMTLYDRALDVNAVLLLCIPGSFVLFGEGFGFIVLALGLGLGLCLYGSKFIMRVMEGKLPGKFKEAKAIKLLKSIVHMGVIDVSKYFALSLLAFGISIVELYYLILAFEVVTFKAVVLCIPLMSLSNLVPISVMGIGVREGVAFYLLSKFSVSGYASVSAVFLAFIINNLLLGIIGTFFLHRVKFTK